eukprot:TRINITY_DN35285_c0_g1_i1.p1 TRINITY_DN35285_c0_g1~~TRINITY_DN35285_c0_g1_i1.p1  ORF type:complete len:538 (+),score=86.98 TRINITY_DN35285_c0_g1_i1:96-1709(+)
MASPVLRPVVSDIFPPVKRLRLDETSSTAVLVYNVSLNDMLVATHRLPDLDRRTQFPEGLPGLGRPLFSAQLSVASSIGDSLGPEPPVVLWQETSKRSRPGKREGFPLGFKLQEDRDENSGPGKKEALPIGFELEETRDELFSVDQLRFRRLLDTVTDADFSREISEEPLFSHRIRAVLFPLLAAVVAAWLRGVAASASRRVVVLASGRAEPRDEGADAQGNSTERTAQLMARFLTAAYGRSSTAVLPKVLHSDGDAFCYDSNLVFCHEFLLPLLDSEREMVARCNGDKWPERFSVTLALCDGTHSRMQVLSQCLREYRPRMAHLTPLKAFWHSCVLCPGDVDHASYETAFEAAPPTEVSKVTDPALSAVISEVVAHRNSFLWAQRRDGHRHAQSSAKAAANDSELDCFWLRKTAKPVLSVLLVQRDGGSLQMHRGINLEVSMPTGSLCAERNVIGTAFATDPSLRREDLRAVAVLAVESKPTSEGSQHAGRNPLAPCGACMEWLKKIHEVNPSFRILMFQDETCRHVFVKTVSRLA